MKLFRKLSGPAQEFQSPTIFKLCRSIEIFADIMNHEQKYEHGSQETKSCKNGKSILIVVRFWGFCKTWNWNDEFQRIEKQNYAVYKHDQDWRSQEVMPYKCSVLSLNGNTLLHIKHINHMWVLKTAPKYCYMSPLWLNIFQIVQTSWNTICGTEHWEISSSPNVNNKCKMDFWKGHHYSFTEKLGYRTSHGTEEDKQ